MKEDDLRILLERLGRDKIRWLPAQGNFSCACPFAPWTHEGKEDRHPSFSVKADDEGSIFRCFTCKESGTVKDMVGRLAQYAEEARPGSVEAKQLWALYDEVERADRPDQRSIVEKGRDVAASKPLPKLTIDERLRRAESQIDNDLWSEYQINKHYMENLHPYLVKRGVSLETARRWGLGFDTRKQRIVFPLRRFKDAALVGMIGRTVIDEEPKYYNYPPINKSAFFFGEHFVKPGAPVIVVEGPTDAISLDAEGIPNPVAVMGSGMSHQQASKLFSWGSSVILMFDGDQAGKEMTIGAARLLRTAAAASSVNFSIVHLPDGEDPASIPRGLAKKLIDEAQNSMCMDLMQRKRKKIY